MKSFTISLTISLVLTVSLVLLTSASASSPREYSPATLISVQEVGQSSAASNYHGDVTDAPLAPSVFTYEFDLRSGCTDYIGHYDDQSDSFGSRFTPNSQAQISVTKHLLYVHMPTGEDMKMLLMKKSPVKGCQASASAAGPR